MTTQTVTSKDGTSIAYDRHGSGPAVILVGGALSYRKYNKMEDLAQLLAERCTVIAAVLHEFFASARTAYR